MVLPELSWNDGFVLLAAALTLWAPGVLIGLCAGWRGWRLASVAPLVTFAVAGLGGPWTSGLGLRWSPWALLAWTALAALIAAALSRLVGRRSPTSEAPWGRGAHLAVAACVAAGAMVSLVATVVGLGRLDTVVRDWDAGFHANGIRWIVETGDGGLDAMTKVNWYAVPDMFYPNAYHLVAAVVQETSGADIPSVLNALTVLTPPLMGLGLAALVHRFGGRAVLAGTAGLLIVAAGPVIDMLWYGPLLPYAYGVACIPAAVILAVDVVEATDLRTRARAVVLLAWGAAALLCLHPGALISGVLFAAPAAAAVLWGVRDRLAGALALGAAGVVAAILTTGQLLGSLRSAAGPSVDWPADLSASDAVGQVLLFQHKAAFPQLWLAAALAVGIVTAHRLGRLRWVGVSTTIFVALFVVAASYDTPWSLAVTRPWWNDRMRLIGVAVLGLVLLAAHGVAEVQRATTVALRRLPPRRVPSPTILAAAVGALVLAVVVLGSGGLYLGRSEAKMANNIGAGPNNQDGPTVTALEEEGYGVLRGLVRPGQRVMNDRGDGSLWMYALDGVRPVFGHYDATSVSSDQVLLAEAFDRYDTDPAVRAAAARLDVGWAVVGRGFIRPESTRQPGLVGLDRVRALRLVYANPDISIYRLDAAPEPSP